MSSSLSEGVSETILISRMRLIVACGTVLNVIIDPTGLGSPHPLTLILSCVYTAQSLGINFLSEKFTWIQESKLVHWVDVIWFTLLLAVDGPLTPFFFLFFFAISTAAFRYGYDEGARVTLVCAASYCLASFSSTNAEMLANVMLRTAILLAVGYMVAHWGEVLLTHKRQIALLRDVSKVSNPRFGVDHTISSVLAHTREYFKATSCLLLSRDHNSNAWRLRTSSNGQGLFATGHYELDDELISPLLSLPVGFNAAFCKPMFSFLPWRGAFFTRDSTSKEWRRVCSGDGRRLADLFDAGSFICVEILLNDEQGRMFVFAPNATLCNADAEFLAQVAAQAFPVIENIQLLDSMVSDAARREREKFSSDLHDTTLQPYIALSYALEALLSKTRADNPIAGELRQIADMASRLIRDLRKFSKEVLNPPSIPADPPLVAALRAHAAAVKENFGIDIKLSGHEALGINDRLGAEVFQLISEGMSNIRRHTIAQNGAVALHRSDGWLHIRIENESPGGPALPFVPRSISQRASSLGGVACVASLKDGATVVSIDIPV